MQYHVNTADAYLDVLADDWRKETLLQVREILHTKAPELTEEIQFKMLSYSLNGQVLFHLNAQKHYVSLYVGNAHKIDADGELLDGLDVGKGCIRLKKSTAVSDTRLPEFVERALSLWQEGQDIRC